MSATSRNKYSARKTVADGITFDSQAEARRWAELQLMQKAGVIAGLTRQVVFELVPPVVLSGRKKPAMKYIADFSYTEAEGEHYTVEDVKGMVTPLFRCKQHLMKHVHGIEVRVTK
jgi:hypothetical protein